MTRLPELPGFTEGLNRLFETYRWRAEDGSVVGFKTETLAPKLRELGYQCSDSYMYQLRSGQKANPSAALIAGLCAAFGDLDARFWYDVTVRVQILRELDHQREALERTA